MQRPRIASRQKSEATARDGLKQTLSIYARESYVRSKKKRRTFNVAGVVENKTSEHWKNTQVPQVRVTLEKSIRNAKNAIELYIVGIKGLHAIQKARVWCGSQDLGYAAGVEYDSGMWLS